jgi:hypothetical protein
LRLRHRISKPFKSLGVCERDEELLRRVQSGSRAGIVAPASPFLGFLGLSNVVNLWKTTTSNAESELSLFQRFISEMYRFPKP